jgi:hypothetical protein
MLRLWRFAIHCRGHSPPSPSRGARSGCVSPSARARDACRPRRICAGHAPAASCPGPESAPPLASLARCGPRRRAPDTFEQAPGRGSRSQMRGARSPGDAGVRFVRRGAGASATKQMRPNPAARPRPERGLPGPPSIRHSPGARGRSPRRASPGGHGAGAFLAFCVPAGLHPGEFWMGAPPMSKRPGSAVQGGLR